ncbi:SSU ribosomal protein S1p [Gracilibacillus boraciitolerans JCM 21714]|uniref:SSU ribosomal protein S1p n=1 Tax=Gracilibacillus boraciitolerans JCM 21714 TaxID=1298598 RepID=W4VF10_9BACI|nr:30S ribosomal protein S1 [Gracilibacillus boraciitolerans]GAE91349.1 SSU ribosomal protein S1p [Gracilibacillus boraciitolerans JCM 21714]
MEEMNQEISEIKELSVGDIVRGKVVKVEEKHVLVDIGYKVEGIVPISELSALRIDTASDVVNEGDELELQVKKLEDEEIVLSKKAIIAEKAWEVLKEKFENNEIIEATVRDVVKGGLVVDVGIRGFIPASLVETHYVEDFADYQDQSLALKIVELDKEQNRIILSHRAVIEQETKEKKKMLLDSLEEGQVLDGTVQRITNFGVFVDIGGLDGLVHISQLAHAHVEKASDLVSEGDTLQVKVLSIDKENEKVSLSHKATQPGPWDNIEEKISVNHIVEGTVKRLVNFGAFVEVLPGVEGLVHISQISTEHIGTPGEVLEVGQKVNVKVLDVNESDKRISLSIKEIEEEQNQKEIKKYESNDEQSGFQLGDMIGNKLDKFKNN